MDEAEIIKAAKDVGLNPYDMKASPRDAINSLQRFAALVAAKEREACATLIQLGPQPVTGFGSKVEIGFGARTAYAAAIRARGQKEELV